MPYLQDRHAEYIGPLELYHCFAAGLPAASMDIPAACAFEPHIHLAGKPRAFVRAVRAALADTMPERAQARRGIAAHHTWEARVEQLSELTEDRLAANEISGQARSRHSVGRGGRPETSIREQAHAGGDSRP
jgi:hypothetical protein